MKMIKILMTTLVFCLPGVTLAAASLETLQHDWSVCQYQKLATEKEACFSTLSQQAHEASRAKSDADASLLIWSAIIDSSLAGEKGGMGALSLVKQARSALEKSIEIDPKALDGSAWTSLGALYYQVPGWPIGFGDSEKAEQMLKKALAINPNGIDPNFFYGDFLLKEDRMSEAKLYLDKALKASARPGREIADSGRRRDIQHDLESMH